MNPITLYGSPLSLYTGKARSYLIKAGLSYQETAPNSDHYINTVLPLAGGRRGIPTLETAQGAVIRDGGAIIEHYESATGHGFSPTSAKQKILSRLFDVIGTEGLLRPAMHYRWNFLELNLAFLKFHFTSMMPFVAERELMAEEAMNAMRNAAQMFGVVPESIELVESLYEQLVVKLNDHFVKQPYLLGGKPCLGDFGLLAPLYAHLGRDPKPLSLMQSNGVNLFRWVERMNRPELDVGEFENQSHDYLPNDDVPDTLIAVLKHLAVDFVPETLAAAQCINQWLDQQDNLVALTAAERGVGLAEFDLNGVTIKALAQPYRFYLLQFLQDDYASLSEPERGEVDSMLAACGMTDVLTCTLDRRIGRENNLEVWL